MHLWNISLLRKLLLVFAGVFLLQLAAGIFILYQVSVHQTQNDLESTNKRIRDDISYQNGTWNVSRYNSDPDAEGAGPVYILGSDGFVIDRWKPIHGFLDTSDIKHLLSYTTPQTITTPTQQTWRIYSKPIIEKGQNVGVVTVASFNPPSNKLDDVDQKLFQTTNLLQNKLHSTGSTLSVGDIDVRDVSFDIAFQVVDKYNKIIAKNNNTNSIDRIPNFIDVSYVGTLLNQPTFQQVMDSQTKEQFLFLTSPLMKSNTVVGVVVSGISIAYVKDLIQSFLVVELFTGIILSMLGVYITYLLIKPQLTQEQTEANSEIQYISFNAKESSLNFDATKIAIPYATNQYYLLEALFSNPKKRFETDELLERFGEHEFGSKRKVYDAMIIVNKKVAPVLNHRLIIAKDKTYQINPQLLSKIY